MTDAALRTLNPRQRRIFAMSIKPTKFAQALYFKPSITTNEVDNIESLWELEGNKQKENFVKKKNPVPLSHTIEMSTLGFARATVEFTPSPDDSSSQFRIGTRCCQTENCRNRTLFGDVQAAHGINAAAISEPTLPEIKTTGNKGRGKGKGKGKGQKPIPCSAEGVPIPHVAILSPLRNPTGVILRAEGTDPNALIECKLCHRVHDANGVARAIRNGTSAWLTDSSIQPPRTKSTRP